MRRNEQEGRAGGALSAYVVTIRYRTEVRNRESAGAARRRALAELRADLNEYAKEEGASCAVRVTVRAVRP